MHHRRDDRPTPTAALRGDGRAREIDPHRLVAWQPGQDDAIDEATTRDQRVRPEPPPVYSPLAFAEPEPDRLPPAATPEPSAVSAPSRMTDSLTREIPVRGYLPYVIGIVSLLLGSAGVLLVTSWLDRGPPPPATSASPQAAASPPRAIEPEPSAPPAGSAAEAPPPVAPAAPIEPATPAAARAGDASRALPSPPQQPAKARPAEPAPTQAAAEPSPEPPAAPPKPTSTVPSYDKPNYD
jgi:hypothetical protein